MTWSLNRRGLTRTVILTRRYALKLPAFDVSWSQGLEGLLANMREVIWCSVDDDRLCPVLFSLPGGWLVVMPRVEVMEPERWEDFDATGFKNRDDLRVPVELKRDSFGVLDGRVVCVDYGGMC